MAELERHGMSQGEIDAVQQRYGKGPHLAADLVVITARWEAESADLRVLLIERSNKPYRGYWALPGGFVDMDEDLEPAARRELQEETGIGDLGLARVEQLRAFGHPTRDPRSRVVSAVHLAWVPCRALAIPEAGDDAATAQFVPIRNGVVQDEHGKALQLAFDHEDVMAEAWEHMRQRASHTSAPLAIAPATFSAAELASLYERLVGTVNPDLLIAWLERNTWIERVDDDRWRPTSSQTAWERPSWIRNGA